MNRYEPIRTVNEPLAFVFKQWKEGVQKSHPFRGWLVLYSKNFIKVFRFPRWTILCLSQYLRRAHQDF